MIVKPLPTSTTHFPYTTLFRSINDVAQPEGTTSSTPPGTTAFAFTVSLSNASTQTITVNYARSTDASTADTDCARMHTSGRENNNHSSTTLTFDPGETSKPVTV